MTTLSWLWNRPRLLQIFSRSPVKKKPPRSRETPHRARYNPSSSVISSIISSFEPAPQQALEKSFSPSVISAWFRR
jgi:hypothetical protein